MDYNSTITLKIVQDPIFPFDWVDLDYYPDSLGKKIEISLTETEVTVGNFYRLFKDLFGNDFENLLIYCGDWWGYSFETWDINSDTYDYGVKNKSKSLKEYLETLEASNLPIGYSGSCKCYDWGTFFSKSMKLLINGTAPYSHLCFNHHRNYFLYFHPTGSIGVYFQDDNLEHFLSLAKSVSNVYDVNTYF